MSTDRNFSFGKAAGYQLFRKLCATTRWESVIPSFFLGRKASILDLATVTAIAPVESEYTDIVQDVRVDRIIGTENRCADFTTGFYPRHEWMAERWVKVYQLLHSDRITEPLKLIEFGGYYFVRDGNHRVSVARHSGINYLTAEIVHYRIPVRLPAGLDRNNLPLFSEKYAFHKRTGVFSLVDEELFCVTLPETWKKLEREIYVHSRSWFVRMYGREPDGGVEHIATWKEFYTVAVEHIRRRSLLLLFPGMGETDVFTLLVEFWNSYEDPDSIWFTEMFDMFERYAHRKRGFLWARQVFMLLVHNFVATAADEREFFLRTTRMTEFVPQFSIPIAGKRFFRLCYSQVFRLYARQAMEEKNHQPLYEILCACWNDEFYAPVLERYRKRLYPIAFETYYARFSRLYFHQVIGKKRSIEDCLEEFEKKLLRDG